MQVSLGLKDNRDWQRMNAGREEITFECLPLCKTMNMEFCRRAFCRAAVLPSFQSALSVCLQYRTGCRDVFKRAKGLGDMVPAVFKDCLQQSLFAAKVFDELRLAGLRHSCD